MRKQKSATVTIPGRATVTIPGRATAQIGGRTSGKLYYIHLVAVEGGEPWVEDWLGPWELTRATKELAAMRERAAGIKDGIKRTLTLTDRAEEADAEEGTDE